MQLKNLLGLAVLATAATLTLSAPTDMSDAPSETTAEIKMTSHDVTAEVKEATVGETMAASTGDVKESSVSAEAKATSAEVKKESDVPTVDAKVIETNKVTENNIEESGQVAKEATSAGETASLSDTKSFQMSLRNVIETVREKEEHLVELEKQLKEATAETSSSKPAETEKEPPKKVSEIIGQFINELVQIPMVILHAVSNAITSFTGNRINLTINRTSPK